MVTPTQTFVNTPQLKKNLEITLITHKQYKLIH